VLVACLGQRACTCDELLLGLRKRLSIIGAGFVTSLGAGAGWTHQRSLSLLCHNKVVMRSYDLSLSISYLLLWPQISTLTFWMVSGSGQLVCILPIWSITDDEALLARHVLSMLILMVQFLVFQPDDLGVAGGGMA